MTTTTTDTATATPAIDASQAKAPRARKSAGKAATERETVPGPAAADPAPARVSRTDQLIALLRTSDGASIDDLCERFGWLPHSARAALTGLRKRGLDVQRTKAGTVTIYRIASA
jgi:hypothetical protein